MFFKPWGTQQPTQQPAPNIPAQSLYQPSATTPSPSSVHPSTPTNPSSTGLAPHTRPAVGGSSTVDSSPQSPSYSQPSPAAGASIIPLLRDKSVDELRKILSDKKAYNEVFLSIDQVKDQRALHAELRRETKQLARKNLEKENQMLELKNQCTVIRTAELATAEEKFHVLDKRVREAMSFLAPGVLLERLQEAAKAAEKESDDLHQDLNDRKIELVDFIQKYKKLRTIYHRRTLLYLAAKHHVQANSAVK